MASMLTKDANGANVAIEIEPNPSGHNQQAHYLVVPGSNTKAAYTGTSLNVHQTNDPSTRRVSSGSTVTRVAGTTTEGQLLAANANRTGASVHNDSTATLYLLCGTGTAAAAFKTVALAQGDVYEIPFAYTGVVRGVWAAANGGADVTEYVV